MIVSELVNKLNGMPQGAIVYLKFYDEFGDDCHDSIDRIYIDDDGDVILTEE